MSKWFIATLESKSEEDARKTKAVLQEKLPEKFEVRQMRGIEGWFVEIEPPVSGWTKQNLDAYASAILAWREVQA